MDNLLDVVNSIYAELDELFYHMEANTYDKATCIVYTDHLKDIKQTLNKINEVNKCGK